MSWIDGFFVAFYQTVELAGVALPQEKALNFVAGFTLTDNPANGSTDVVSTAGGAIYRTKVTSTTAAVFALNQTQPIDTSGGAFTLTLPTSSLVPGMLYTILDQGATSQTTGVWTYALTVSGGTNPVQNPNTSSTSATSFVFGQANQIVGGTNWFLLWTGSFWQSLGVT